MPRHTGSYLQDGQHTNRNNAILPFTLGLLLAIPISWSIAKIGAPTRADSSGCTASLATSHSQSPAKALQPLAWCASSSDATCPLVATVDSNKAAAVAPRSMPATSFKPAAQVIQNALSTLAGSAQGSDDKVFVNPLATWRRRFVQDTPDPNWSSMAEAQAESYLAETVDPDVELVSVSCAGTVCEVQAASKSAEDSGKAANEWQSSMSAMSNESWWNSYGFATPNTAIWTAADGRTFFVSYLTRASH
jgi:hypothetical protein